MGRFIYRSWHVSHWDASLVAEARAHAVNLFGAASVTPVMRHNFNCGATFFIAPSGSKAGWGPDDLWQLASTEFSAWLSWRAGFDAVCVGIGEVEEPRVIIDYVHGGSTSDTSGNRSIEVGTEDGFTETVSYSTRLDKHQEAAAIHKEMTRRGYTGTADVQGRITLLRYRKAPAGGAA